MFLQTVLYCWVSQVFHEASFQIINISIQSAVKTGLHIYNDTSYSRSGVNQMWILTNSYDLFEYIKSRSISSCNSIKTFNFSTLYTTIPRLKIKKNRLKQLVQLWNWQHICYVLWTHFSTESRHSYRYKILHV